MSKFIIFLITKLLFFSFFVFVEGNTWNDVDRYICACFGYGQTKSRCRLSKSHRHIFKHSNIYLWNILIVWKDPNWDASEIPGYTLSPLTRSALFHFIIFLFCFSSLWNSKITSNLFIFVKKIKCRLSNDFIIALQLKPFRRKLIDVKFDPSRCLVLYRSFMNSWYKICHLRLLRPLRRSALLSRTFRLWANQSEAVFSLVTLWRSGHSKNYVRAYLGVSFHTHDYGLRIDFGRQA